MVTVVTGTGRVSKLLHREMGAVMVSHADCRLDRIPPCDTLIHAGARVFAEQSKEFPLTYIQKNVIETYYLLQHVRTLRPQPFFVYLSTFEAEDCETPYAASKLAAEGLARAWRASYGLRAMVVRLPNLFIMDPEDQGFVGKARRGEIDAPREPRRKRTWLLEKDFVEELRGAIRSGGDCDLSERGVILSDQYVFDLARKVPEC